MEIHELNTFSGTLGSGDFFATDNGNDTSKVSAEDMFGPINDRIDNIITSPAPSAEEVTDARLGADGITYASLGAAIRSQAENIQDYLSQVESLNLIGTDAGTLYPVNLKAGKSIVCSTADGSAFNQDYRIYYYDANGAAIDWFGLYRSQTVVTKTFSADVRWLSWRTNQPPTQNIMVNIGANKAPYKPYEFTPHNYEYKGHIAPDSFSEVLDTGWYMLKSGANPSDIPLYHSDSVQLRVYNKGVSTGRIVQELVDGRGQHYIRTLSQNGSSPSPWRKFAKENDVLVNIENLNSKVVSLSGNVFDYDNAEWSYGIYSSRQGTVSGGAPYKYAIVPLQGEGTYIKTGLKASFGANFTAFALLDENKSFIGYIDGTPDASDTEEKYSSGVTLSEDVISVAKYTVLHMDESNPYIPKLFYNSDVQLTDKESPFAYGFTTDKLYKKAIVCDGDSICAGVADLPKQFGAYFGRIKMGYQISGTNYAVGGGTICDMTNTTVSGQPRHSVAVNIDSIHSDYSELDYLILEGGTNDADLIGPFVGDTPPERFGSWSETDFSGVYDKTTFCGGVEYLFYKALTYYPHAKIGFIIAMQMGTSNSSVSNRKRYFDEIVKIAKKWHIPVLNMWEEAGADARLLSFYDSSKTPTENVTAKSFYYDGQHPTSYGYDKMQNRIEEWMKTL